MAENKNELETKLLGLLRGEHSSLTIDFNDHSSNYMTAADAESNGLFERVDWVSPEEKSAALKNNSVWILQWYPDTPIGFCCKGASSLAALLDDLGHG